MFISKMRKGDRVLELSGSLFAEGFSFLEAPRWRDGHLWAVEVFGSNIRRFASNGDVEIVRSDLPPCTNSMSFMADGSIVFVASKTRQLLRLRDGEVSVHADLSHHISFDINDFIVDSDGRIYIGNYGYDSLGGEAPQSTSLHIVEPDGRVKVGPADLDFPNGTVIINGGRTLVTAETWCGRLTAFDRHEDGSLSGRRLFASLEGRNPDGICADAEGAIWVPSFHTGELLRVLDGGEITHACQLPGYAIATTLGGVDGRTLFCTTFAGSIEAAIANEPLGAIYTLQVDVPGAA